MDRVRSRQFWGGWLPRGTSGAPSSPPSSGKGRPQPGQSFPVSCVRPAATLMTGAHHMASCPSSQVGTGGTWPVCPSCSPGGRGLNLQPETGLPVPHPHPHGHSGSPPAGRTGSGEQTVPQQEIQSQACFTHPPSREFSETWNPEPWFQIPPSRPWRPGDVRRSHWVEGSLLCSWGDQGACAVAERAGEGWEGQRLRPDAASRSKGWKQKRQLGTGRKHFLLTVG